MLTEIIIKGSIRTAIAYLADILTKILSYNQYKDEIPEIAYCYGSKSSKRTYNRKKNKIINVISVGLYFIPILGTILLVLSLILDIGYVAILAHLKKDYELNNSIKTITNDVVLPEEYGKELERGKEMYKQIANSLKLDGLDDEMIKKELDKAKKEYPCINGNNDKKIEKNNVRIQNLQLLSEFKDYLVKPMKAYKYTVDKKIEYADVDGDILTIGVSKLNNESKMLTKKFKLKK